MAVRTWQLHPGGILLALATHATRAEAFCSRSAELLNSLQSRLRLVRSA